MRDAATGRGVILGADPGNSARGTFPGALPAAGIGPDPAAAPTSRRRTT
jgi:hypothetical protein